jgi:hypothetical protein
MRVSLECNPLRCVRLRAARVPCDLRAGQGIGHGRTPRQCTQSAERRDRLSARSRSSAIRTTASVARGKVH